ncbi:MAG: 3-hydroxyacyl-CoA dehydrogenase NAD-binding domain-containing protein [Schleiferiaceae bacterium]|nr:3-hydroxyacyl-CoA dehydrogenase NAD-binding domain-containing protein [Schleiferiaceae bacterium]
MKKITVIGAGTMGNGIAHVFAINGFDVMLFDINEKALAKSIINIEKNINRQISKELLTPDAGRLSLERIQLVGNLEQAVTSADIVIEAATENESLKLQIFSSLSTLVSKETILATNTSSISIGKIAAVTKHPENVIGMHFMNPVPVMKLVEIISGYKTSEKTTAAITQLSKKLGKTPVACNDYPGFVANRILMPMINEAIESLQNGVAGVSEIDSIMKLGMGHPMGPLQLADFIGLDVCLSILNVMYQGYGTPKYSPNPVLINLVTSGDLGVKSGKGFYDYSNGIKNPTVAYKA